MKAVWNGTLLAESDAALEIEGNQYFPADSVLREHLVPSDTTLSCPWKGTGIFYSLMAEEGEELKDAAWTFETPPPEAIEKIGTNFSGYVAFWRGVEVTDEEHGTSYQTPGPTPDQQS